MAKLPKWSKIIWWVILAGFLVFLFFQRYESIISGATTPIDIVILLLLIAWFAIPLFQEVNIFGVSFKKEIDGLKNDIEKQLISLKSEIRNTVNIYPYGSLPSDAELPDLRKMVDKAVRDAVKGGKIEHPVMKDFKTPETTQFLFNVRFQIDNSIRRIYDERGEEPRPGVSILSALRRFVHDYELVSEGLYRSIRDVYSICSAAIHGEEISEAKVNFVRDVAPELIESLESIANQEMEHKS